MENIESAETCKIKSVKCAQCGNCCHYVIDGKLIRCRYLVDTDDGKTRCKVYVTRLGRILNRKPLVRCNIRSLVSQNYDGCPYNKGE